MLCIGQERAVEERPVEVGRLVIERILPSRACLMQARPCHVEIFSTVGPKCYVGSSGIGLRAQQKDVRDASEKGQWEKR